MRSFLSVLYLEPFESYMVGVCTAQISYRKIPMRIVTSSS